MKIALTGASSTGKTTLAAALLDCAEGHALFQHSIQVDARSMLRLLDKQQMDLMSPEELRCFQVQYYRRKVRLEAASQDYIADRSFVDVAAYWLARDTVDADIRLQSLLPDRCRRLAQRYDYHFLLPLGIIPFVYDGYRSNTPALHLATEGQIRTLLMEWSLPFEVLDMAPLSARVDRVLAVARALRMNGHA